MKTVARGCVVCKRRSALPDYQKMADLLGARVDPWYPPLYSVGLDCFGPYTKKKINKNYGEVWQRKYQSIWLYIYMHDHESRAYREAGYTRL